MIYGVQTHFNSEVDPAILAEVAGFHFTGARIDAQTCSVDVMLAMVDDARSAGLTPLVIVADTERLDALPSDLDIDWTNEPDGDVIPQIYRQGLDDACRVAAARGQRLWAPAISNLDANSLLWLQFVRGEQGWPAGLYGISAHRYGDGTFEEPHDGFDSREEEVAALKNLCDGRPFLITEWGYPAAAGPSRLRNWRESVKGKPRRSYKSVELTEADQAERFTQEWAFWLEQGAAGSFAYQLNDGTEDNEHYGIRRLDGTYKPSASTVPYEGGGTVATEYAELTPNHVFAKTDLIALDGRAGEYSLRYPPGTETILSPKKDGNHELRPMSSCGNADETCTVTGDLVYFPNVNGVRLAWRLVE